MVHPGPQQLRALLRQRAREQGTELSENAAAAILERCGQDMFLLENEVDKLAAASGYTEISPRWWWRWAPATWRRMCSTWCAV